MPELNSKFTVSEVYGSKMSFEITRDYGDGTYRARNVNEKSSEFPSLFFFSDLNFAYYETHGEIQWL